jgi:arylsulfatase A-like enzyme
VVKTRSLQQIFPGDIMADQPNIILIMADQWRHDGLGVVGNPVAQTPHLDKLASEGALFTHAYSAVPSCIPARAALLTGQHQRHHGRVGYMDNIPWTYPVTMGSVFSGAGYHTQAVGKMHVAPARNLVGFHNVILHDGYLHWNRRRHPTLIADDDYLADLRQKYGPAADYTDSGIGCNGYAVNPWPYDIMLHPTAWVTTQSIDFLRRRDPGKPFFLKVSYHRPHPPLDPPQAYFDMYRDVELPPLPQGDWVGRAGLPAIDKFPSTPESPILMNERGIDQARRAYYAQCTFIDHQINRLIMALIEHRVWNNTAIVFTADHSEMLYDHGLIAKTLPYENSAGIPLIIRPPLNMGIKGGVRLDQPVELRDILPTLCDIAGIPVPPEVDGVSVLPLIRGEQLEWRDWLHGEHERGLLSNHWLTDGKLKYCWYSQTGAEQLFDLQEDPYECHDLVDKWPAELVKWRNRLIKELQGREEGFVQDGQLVVGRPVSPLLKEAGLPDPPPLPAYLR